MKKLNMKIVVIGILALIAVLAIFVNPLAGEPVTFSIPDRCGNFINVFSHSIPDEGACRSQCRNQCSAQYDGFHSVEFIESQAGCHTCTCSCKK